MAQEIILNSNQTCTRCHKSDLCKIFDRVVDGVSRLPNEGQTATNREVIFVALANCCSKFQNVQKFKSGGPEPV
jgi:hypothetical protein